MNIKNLQRAAEINEELTLLKAARPLVSKEDAQVIVRAGGVEAVLPRTLIYNVSAAMNAAINMAEKEVKEL